MLSHSSAEVHGGRKPRKQREPLAIVSLLLSAGTDGISQQVSYFFMYRGSRLSSKLCPHIGEVDKVAHDFFLHSDRRDMQDLLS